MQLDVRNDGIQTLHSSVTGNLGYSSVISSWE